MRKVVDKVEHQSVFHQHQEIRDSIQEPIVNKFKRNFFLGRYGCNYCPDCGRLMNFIVDKGDKYTEAAYICRPCGGKERPSYVNYGFGI